MKEEFDIFKNRFSETALKIVHDCEQIAASMGPGIDTQHLLLSLSSTPGTISFEILRELMINPQRISFLLQSRPSDFKTKSGVSTELKQSLKAAFAIADKYKSLSVESEHLLLSLLGGSKNNAKLVLAELGVEPTMLEHQLHGHLEQSSPTSETDGQDLSGLPEPLDGFIGPALQNQPRSSGRGKSALEFFTTDLTKQAREKKLDPMIGREKELQRIIQILVRRNKNNPVLTGEPGVGKTAIIEGLAQKIADGDVPRYLLDKRVLSLDLAQLIAGTTYRGQFEERTKKLIDEIVKAGNIVLFVDELHTIVGAGSAEGSMDLSNIIKPGLAKGALRLIGATTSDEYRKYIEKDPALERRLQRILVDEPSVDETIQIIHGLKSAYEKHHHVVITDEAINSAANLSKRYISDRFLPDKAIDLIDEAAAATQLEEKQLTAFSKINSLERRKRYANSQRQKAADKYEYKTAAEYRMLELRLESEVERLKKKLPKRTITREITKEDVAKIVSMWTGIPVTALTQNDRIKVANLEAALGSQIVGQSEAIKTITASIKRSATGVADPKRPLGSFIFLGPTGVGKTELARVLAREVFGRDEALVKIDMSEFMERHNLSRLVGAPPGYVGFEESGKLTEAIRRQPYSVVLLDEIEKAHPDVFNMLLQIMEDGYLTDAKGRRVNFRNTIIIMTSNLGMAEMNQTQAIGFNRGVSADLDQRYEEIKSQILERMKKDFRPEFINRLDKIVVFRPLNKADVTKIVEKQAAELAARLLPEGITITIEPSAKEFLAEKGFDPEFGARPVRRVITEYIEDPLSEMLLTGKLSKKAPIKVRRRGEKLALVK